MRLGAAKMEVFSATWEVEAAIVQTLLFVVVLVVVYSTLERTPWNENPIRIILALAFSGLCVMGLKGGKEGTVDGLATDGDERVDVISIHYGDVFAWVLWCVLVCVILWICDKIWGLSRSVELDENGRKGKG